MKRGSTVFLLAAAVLIAGSGCASRSPVIQETIIFRDLIGTWRSTGGELVELTLTQQGSSISGTLLTVAGNDNLGSEASISGTVNGNMFHFKQAAGGVSIEGEMTVNGNEMTGNLRNATVSGATRFVRLRRVQESSQPGSK